MTEEEIIDLGFNKETQEDYHYYTKDITNGLSFTTNANDETLNNDWYIEFFNTEIPIRYYNVEDVKELLKLIYKGKIE